MTSPIRNQLALAIILVGLGATGASAQQSPRSLPAPEVPLTPLLSGGDAVSQQKSVAAAQTEPYLGPPTAIDGPGSSGPPAGLEFSPEEIAPGATREEALFPPTDPFAIEPFGDVLVEDDLLGQPQKLSSYRNSFFQKLSLSAGWYGNSDDPNDLGGTEIETFLTVALPAPTVQWPLLISPGFNVTLISGATITDLPERLYLTYVDFMWLPKVYDHWTLLLSVQPTVYGDFDANELRLTGKALVIYDWEPDRLQFIAGLLYLNRDNIRVLPAGGAIWTPVDWMRLELIFPKPKVGVRINVGPGYEDWVYTTAEFGGNTWPILRSGDVRDSVTYVDYRILGGFERKLDGGAGYRLELGYVFGRSIEFGSGQGNFDPTNTALLRGGITF